MKKTKAELEQEVEAKAILINTYRRSEDENKREIRKLNEDVAQANLVLAERNGVVSELERSRDLIIDIISGEAKPEGKIEVLQDLFFMQVQDKKNKIKDFKEHGPFRTHQNY